MDWQTALNETTDLTKDFRKAHPEAAKAFTQMHHAALSDGALSTKDKELQCVAIGIATRCVDCIGFHVHGAAKAGATRDEIVETIATCIMMGGGPSYMYGVKALEAFDQLA
ncbi:carboxymuconolactone decarboxylase family protein [Marivivens marinus]|uniref:carboxymuconolactone decarboxylase family protein n=1 Tax=Marivivens marinus TaxID=3110173 RepID=UPI003B845496